jgi:hypothetical protein
MGCPIGYIRFYPGGFDRPDNLPARNAFNLPKLPLFADDPAHRPVGFFAAITDYIHNRLLNPTGFTACLTLNGDGQAQNHRRNHQLSPKPPPMYGLWPTYEIPDK